MYKRQTSSGPNSNSYTDRVKIGETSNTILGCNIEFNGTISTSNLGTDSSPGHDVGLEAITFSGFTSYEFVRDTSSRKYKTNIQSLTVDSSKIYNLNPVSFITKDTNKSAFGLIAEEVYEELPELVGVVDGEPESVRYTRLPVLLLAEIKKLKNRIETLENS